MIDIQLVPIDSVQPSTYNPRSADEKRLKQIELSLRKLGFILPIFADKNGEILSGHQRHLVATRMGLTHVPVCYTKPLTLEQRKAYNIAFNRGTNDVERNDTGTTIKKKMAQHDIQALAEKVEDLDSSSQSFFTCLGVQEFDIKRLLEKNINKLSKYCTNMAKMLKGCGAFMPIVIDEDMNVINGIGRLQMFAEMKKTKVDVVIVPNHKSELAYCLLNYLTMDFDIHTRYKDLLRYNSFRRAMANRPGIGRGFIAGLWPSKTKVQTFTTEQKKEWIAKYGTNIVDFGAGHLTDTKKLRNMGINCTPFEPYFLQGSEIDKEASLKIVNDFLDMVETGTHIDTIFISSVFNSVPFKEDREKIAVITSALCDSKTTVVCWTMNRKGANWQLILKEPVNEKANAKQFPLEYESGTIVGNLSDKPKVQKFHTRKELVDIFRKSFYYVFAKDVNTDIYLEANVPMLNRDKLREALEFEFELPYPDGSRMGLSKRAKQAFSKRLNIHL